MKKWLVSSLNKDKISLVADEMNISPLLVMLLFNRGYTDVDSIRDFLFGDDHYASSFDAMEFADMDKAVKRIRKAIDNFESICIYGDYDVDGVTSTALLYMYLESQGANVTYFIPDRKSGYGLNNTDIERLRKEQSVSLIVTVDNGVSAVNEIDFASELGIDVVITDHHKLPDKLPNAVAIVDPHRDDCPSRFKEYAGVGVAFKLMCALEGKSSSVYDLLDEYADIVAIGTISDIVPLVSENRFLSKYGLSLLEKEIRPGIQRLLDLSCTLEKKITSSIIAFSLAPRINAVGRLDLAEKAVKMLTSNNTEEAENCADFLNECNTIRKEIETKIIKEIESRICASTNYDQVLVVDGENFHTGVIGIVASKLVSKYCKPCIVISIEGDMARGSGRSVEGFSLYDAVKSWFDENTTDGHMNGSNEQVKFGGHTMAIGFDIPVSYVESLKCKVNEYAARVGVPPLALKIDCKLKPESLDYSMIRDIELLEPFGCENRFPVFGLYEMKILDIVPLGGGKHLKIVCGKGSTKVSAMKFSTTLNDFEFMIGDVVDLAVTLNKNEFKGQELLSIFITEMKCSQVNEDQCIADIRLYESIKRKEDISCETINKVIPTRNEFAVVYRFFEANHRNYTCEMLMYRIGENSIGLCKLLLILDIMEELSLVTKTVLSNGKYHIKLCHQKNKVSLDSSKILQELKGLR